MEHLTMMQLTLSAKGVVSKKHAKQSETSKHERRQFNLRRRPNSPQYLTISVKITDRTLNPFKDEAQTALFKAPVRTAL